MSDGDPRCPYCGALAEFLGNSERLYHGRDYGPVWICWPCEAWVGVHEGSLRPLGRLANAELREAKIRAHTVFDALWTWKHIQSAYRDQRRPHRALVRIARSRAYLWLAEAMGISPAHCHIGEFDVRQCRAVVTLIEHYAPTPASIRAWAQSRTALARVRAMQLPDVERPS